MPRLAFEEWPMLILNIVIINIMIINIVIIIIIISNSGEFSCQELSAGKFDNNNMSQIVAICKLEQPGEA